MQNYAELLTRRRIRPLEAQLKDQQRYGAHSRRGRREVHLRAAGNHFSQGRLSRRSGAQRRSRQAQTRIPDLRHRHFRFRMPGESGVDLLKLDERNRARLLLPADHRRAHRGDRDRRDQFGRRPLRDQGSRTGRSVAPRGSRSFRKSEVEERSRLSAARTSPAHRPRQHHRAKPEDARDFRSDPDGRAAIQPRADHRRKRHR